jgi:hypothetical protein
MNKHPHLNRLLQQRAGGNELPPAGSKGDKAVTASPPPKKQQVRRAQTGRTGRKLSVGKL